MASRSEYAEVVGGRLRAARGDRPATEIAGLLGITTATLYRWETGSIVVPHERFGEVADVLDASWDELFAPAAAVDSLPYEVA